MRMRRRQKALVSKIKWKTERQFLPQELAEVMFIVFYCEFCIQNQRGIQF